MYPDSPGSGADVKRSPGQGRDRSGAEPGGRVRGPGGGRPAWTAWTPGWSPRWRRGRSREQRRPYVTARWTTKSTANLAGELTRQGHQVTARTVARLLAGAGYSLQGNAKTIEGKQHPDRDAQFRYINAQVTAFQADGSPVISVDAKKKENVGNFRNGGNGRRPGSPSRSACTTSPTRNWARRCPTGSTT